MHVIFRVPMTPEGMEVFSRRLNEANLTMVANNINKLNCPYGQEVERLLKDRKQTVRTLIYKIIFQD